MINTLTELKKNPIIAALNSQQNKYDNVDDNILKGNFTRSPLHVIQFLIIYAGLDQGNRIAVLKNLNNEIIEKDDLDKLILDINWVNILHSIGVPEELAFEFRIGINDPKQFFGALKEKCLLLFQAFVDDKCVVKVLRSTRNVVFTSKVSQRELWEIAFNREAEDKFWKVPRFVLSPLLKKQVATLPEGKSEVIGAFNIKKGTGKLANEVELHIMAPNATNEFSIENKISVNSGIYEAFKGLRFFYGLGEVEGVIVNVQSEAKFSDQGAYCSQTEVVDCYEECAYSNDPAYGSPTIITVEGLRVFFNGLDIGVNFNSELKPSTDLFNKDIFIKLPTKSAKTGICLFSSMPTPTEAASLYLNNQEQVVDTVLSNSTVKTFFPSQHDKQQGKEGGFNNLDYFY